MRVMVTGAAGFVGGFLRRALCAAGHECVATDMAPAVADVLPLDVRDAAAVQARVAACRPEACVHLAGIAFVPDAAQDAQRLEAINVTGTENLGAALARHAPRCRLLFVSTAQVYGPAAPSNAPMDEATPLQPTSAYARSKADAEARLLRLQRESDVDVVIARPGNHIGPGQSPKFVVAAFAAALRACLRGERPDVPVGNLASTRDFSDVRDVVAAYLLLLAEGRAGMAYNISAGAQASMGEMLERLMRLAGIQPPVVVDPARYRPTDTTPLLDTTRLRQTTRWQPRFTLDQTLQDIWQATANAIDCA